MTNSLNVLENIGSDLITNQIAAYQKVQESLAAQAGSDSLLQELADLRYTLSAADQAAQETYYYQQAGDLFLKAFRVDPHNAYFYWLAQLMQELAQASQGDPADWEAACDQLAGRADYDFTAARHYLERARVRVNENVRQLVQLIRDGLLDAARERLQIIDRSWGRLPPPLQCLQAITDSYWQLYDYAKQYPHRVAERLNQAETTLNQAEAINAASTRFNQIQEELVTLRTLLQIYQALYQANDYDFAPYRQQLQSLPQQDDHVFIKRLAKELDGLDTWRTHFERVLADCQNHRYDEAIHYVETLTDLDRDAVGWLNPATAPDLNRWENFSRTAQRGVDAWRQHHYSSAKTDFSKALATLPLYLDGRPPESLHHEFDTLVQDMNTLLQSLTNAQQVLSQAADYDQYRPLVSVMEPARQVEARYTPLFGGDGYIAAIVDRAGRFVDAAARGHLPSLQQLCAEGETEVDMLAGGYRRIELLIRQGLQPNAPIESVETALKLAPECESLAERRESIIALATATNKILEAVQQARFDDAWRELRTWEAEQGALPPGLVCLWHLTTGYDHLIGPAGQNTGAAERLQQATQSLREAERICQSSTPTRQSRELNTLDTMVKIYRRLNRQGLDYLSTAKGELQTLYNTGLTPNNHAPIRLFSTRLDLLERWLGHRDHMFEFLSQYQYKQGLGYLEQIPAQEKEALEWVSSQSGPGWEGWEKFCLDAQRGFSLWQAQEYQEAWAHLNAVGQQVPTDMTHGQTQRLQEQFEQLGRDLVTIEKHLKDSARLLQQANQAEIYQQVGETLEQARALESSYFPRANQPLPPVNGINGRFQMFAEAARRGELSRMVELIAQAQQAKDPLAPGYEYIHAILARGQADDATRAGVEAAQGLAPMAKVYAQRIEQFEIEAISSRVLKDLRAGRLEQAGKIIDSLRDERAGSSQFQCLVDIFAGYQHLYGQSDTAESVLDRITAARQYVNRLKNCQGTELVREQNTLKSLVRLYGNVHARRWRNLERDLAKLREETTPDPDQASHAYIRQLGEQIAGLEAWQARRERILDHWREQHFNEAQSELQELTDTERKAAAWFDDETRQLWEIWRDFGGAAQRGVEAWEQHDYDTARTYLNKAANGIPADLKKEDKETLETFFGGRLEDLNALYANIDQAREHLLTLSAAAYGPAAEALQAAQAIESRYHQDHKDKQDNASQASHMAGVIDRYEQFRQAAMNGDTSQMSQIAQAGRMAHDPLVEPYDRIYQLVNQAKQPRASQELIQEALTIAPNDPTLIELNNEMERRKQLIPKIAKISGAAIVGLIILGAIIYFLVQANANGGNNGNASQAAPAAPASGEQQAAAAVADTPTPEPTEAPPEVPTATPEPTETPTEAPTATPESTETPTVEPTPTETVPVPTVAVARSGRFQDLFDGDLGGWNRDYTFIEDEPSIYLNQNNQWNIWTADEPFEFWLDQPSQLPVDFSVTLSILQPTTAHGLLIRDPDTEQTFGFYVRQTEDGPWEYEIRQDGSPIISGLSQTYSQDTAPFNRLTITLADEVLLFNINDQENVFGYNYVGKTSPWWNLGLGADAGGHAIIGSARTYFLVPQ